MSNKNHTFRKNDLEMAGGPSRPRTSRLATCAQRHRCDDSRDSAEKAGYDDKRQSLSETRRAARSRLTRLDMAWQHTGLKAHWSRFRQRMSTTSTLSESFIDDRTETTMSVRRFNRDKDVGEKEAEDEEVDEVVVDNDVHNEYPPPELAAPPHFADPPSNPNVDQSREGNRWDAGSMIGSVDTANNPAESAHLHLWTLLRRHVWPAIESFFTLRFFDEKTEAHYRRETWFTSKSLAMYSSLFFILNWILSTALAVRPFDVPDHMFYLGLGPLLAIPLPLLVIFDVPRYRPILYQTYLLIAVWCWPLYQSVYMYACGFYGPLRFSCGRRDFLGMSYYSIGLASIAMFGLRQTRLANAIGSLVLLVTQSVLIAPYHFEWTRNILNMTVFHIFLMYIHYKRETAERRLFSLRDQLKIQFRATQKAQVNERKAADSKRRLTSYVFHEVRVPLNTALLAVQNLEATATVAKEQEIEWAALEGSLSMMSKVLNDVLDFDRLDSGRFSTVHQPYNLHQAIRSMLVPLRLAADARGLQLQIELDRTIDQVARRAAYEALGRADGWISRELAAFPDEDGIVVGDEMRLRQVITNLASNACKFTPAGGQIRVVTKLVRPVTPPQDAPLVPNTAAVPDPSTVVDDSSAEEANPHKPQPMPLNQIVVRIEVHDTGVGIRARDLVDHKLFSPYVQTEIGKYQGGKGTGLGLALVRRIVKLSGGRLGVRSKSGCGSEFWVELPLGVGEKAVKDAEYNPCFNADGSEHCAKAAGLGAVQFYNTHHSATSADSLTCTTTKSVSSTQTDPALRTIMEQRGRFELGARRCSIDGALPPAMRLSRSFSDTGSPTIREHFLPPRPKSPLASRACMLPGIPDSPVEPPATSARMRMRSAASSPAVPTVAGARRASPQRDSGASVKSAASSGSLHIDAGLRVLVVDDDALTRRLMTRMLTRLGCAVDVAENGQVALSKIVQRDAVAEAEAMGAPASPVSPSTDGYDIVFLDNQMPVMSGLDTVAALRARGRTDLVVGVTGNALLTDQQEYLAVGVDRVLTKPVLERSLRAMLVVAGERRRRAGVGL